MTQLDSASELYCPGCGYDLRSIGSDRCPECGLTVDRSQLGQSNIPWLHREKLGRYRAFWKTVRLVSLHPRTLAHEMSCPPHLADALKFRRLVALHVWTPLALLSLIGAVLSDPPVWNSLDAAGSIVQVMTIGIAVAGMWFWTLMVLGLQSYFFHPASLDMKRQNRAVALSYYACAPLAYSPLTILMLALAVVGVSLLADAAPSVVVMGVLCLFGGAPITLQVILLGRSSHTLLRALTHCGLGRHLLMDLIDAAASLMLALLLIAAIPLAVGFVGMMILSVIRQVA